MFDSKFVEWRSLAVKKKLLITICYRIINPLGLRISCQKYFLAADTFFATNNQAFTKEMLLLHKCLFSYLKGNCLIASLIYF